jgi:PKD repeat protein
VSKAGKYAVKVKDNTLGCISLSDTINVTVNPKPKSDFLTSGELKVYTPITFSDHSANAVTWFWDFGDGQSSSDQNPTHSYTVIKSYSVKLTVTGSDGCADTKANSISVITEIETPPIENVAIYPNPVSADYLVVTTPIGSNGAVVIMDILGRPVAAAALNAQSEEQRIFVGNLNDGIYIVRVSAGQGQLTRKIVIKR